VRWAGIALAVWAVDAALLARASRRVVRRTVLVAGLGNLAWEAATVVLIALGAFSMAGAGLALGLAAAAGGLGLLQLRALRSTR
jgi:p-aminobenzoyl-glutamate transporter AbgT